MWVMGRVSEGMGQGRDFCTLEKPLPLAGVKGIHKDKKKDIYHIYLPKRIFLYLTFFFWNGMKSYYSESESC
jgi:hypothetical protein